MIIDVQSRDFFAMNHFIGAKNIPLDELPVRGVNELSANYTIVVYGNFDKDGEKAQEVLGNNGFKKVYILNYQFPNPSVPTISDN